MFVSVSRLNKKFWQVFLDNLTLKWQTHVAKCNCKIGVLSVEQVTFIKTENIEYHVFYTFLHLFSQALGKVDSFPTRLLATAAVKTEPMSHCTFNNNKTCFIITIFIVLFIKLSLLNISAVVEYDTFIRWQTEQYHFNF